MGKKQKFQDGDLVQIASEGFQRRMTYKKLIESLQEDLNEETADLAVEFVTINRGGMHLLSVIPDDDDGSIRIDIGTEEDNDENNRTLTDRLYTGAIIVGNGH